MIILSLNEGLGMTAAGIRLSAGTDYNGQQTAAAGQKNVGITKTSCKQRQ
jgi:hypothetical protein